MSLFLVCGTQKKGSRLVQGNTGRLGGEQDKVRKYLYFGFKFLDKNTDNGIVLISVDLINVQVRTICMGALFFLDSSAC